LHWKNGRGQSYPKASDADCLTFGTRLLIRNLMAAESQKKQIYEISLELILEQLGIMDQFIDFCILCGCDYCDTIKGVGPSTAIKLIMSHGSLEKVLESLDSEKVPENFRYQAARDFFRECEAVATDSVEFEFKEPDFEGLAKFLVEGNSFAQERVDRYVERLKAAKSRTKQKPLSSFFGAPKVEIKDSDKFDPNKKKGGAKAKAKAGGEKRKAVGSTSDPAKRARSPTCA